MQARDDAEAKLRIGKSKLEAADKYIALSESGSSVAVSGRYKRKICHSSIVASSVPETIDTGRTDINGKCENADFRESGNVAAASSQPAWAASKACCFIRFWQFSFTYGSALEETTLKVERTCLADSRLGTAASSQRHATAANAVTSNTLGFEAYLEH